MGFDQHLLQFSVREGVERRDVSARQHASCRNGWRNSQPYHQSRDFRKSSRNAAEDVLHVRHRHMMRINRRQPDLVDEPLIQNELMGCAESQRRPQLVLDADDRSHSAARSRTTSDCPGRTRPCGSFQTISQCLSGGPQGCGSDVSRLNVLIRVQSIEDVVARRAQTIDQQSAHCGFARPREPAEFD